MLFVKVINLVFQNTVPLRNEDRIVILRFHLDLLNFFKTVLIYDLKPSVSFFSISRQMQHVVVAI